MNTIQILKYINRRIEFLYDDAKQSLLRSVD